MRFAPVQQMQAEVDYYRDRLALLRAQLYRRGMGTNTRLQELERQLEGAERRLRDARVRAER